MLLCAPCTTTGGATNYNLRRKPLNSTRKTMLLHQKFATKQEHDQETYRKI
jgi:hypothetical protein